MVTIPPLPVGNALMGEIVLIALIAVVLLIVFKLGKFILKIVFGVIANSILGLVALFLLNSIFFAGSPIPVELATLVPTAIFGLPAVGTLVILHFFTLI